MKQLYFTTSTEWRQWLQANYDQESEVWLIFYRKGTGHPSISYDAAVEEALCFGWIDSIVKRVDESRYAQKFTPRRDHSKWSESNKKRVVRLIAEHRMAEPGLEKIEAAKRIGSWDTTSDWPTFSDDIPVELQRALQENPTAGGHFERLAPSHRKRYITWIAMAKREETRRKRAAEAVALLEKGEKLGLK